MAVEYCAYCRAAQMLHRRQSAHPFTAYLEECPPGFGWDEATGSTSFTGARMVLCFAFVVKTVWITQRCFGYCWTVLAQCQSFLSVFPHPAKQVDWGWEKCWEGVYPGELSQTDQRATPYHKASCSAIKLRERRRKQEFQSYGICLSKQLLRMLRPLSGNDWTSACWWEAVN